MFRWFRRVEPRALLLLLCVTAAVWAFLNIGDEMAEGETMGLDRRLLLMLRSPGDGHNPIGSAAVQEALRDITALGGFTVLTLATVVGAVAFAIHRRWRHVAILVGAVMLAQVCSELLKSLYDRPRPDLVPHAVYVYSGSFPSGHSMLAATTYLTLAVLISSLEPVRAAKWLVFVMAVLLMAAVGFSRVYLGVHWPSDVLAGWCAGCAWAFAAWVVLRMWKDKTVEARD